MKEQFYHTSVGETQREAIDAMLAWIANVKRHHKVRTNTVSVYQDDYQFKATIHYEKKDEE